LGFTLTVPGVEPSSTTVIDSIVKVNVDPVADCICVVKVVTITVCL
jgi:hypothetical protein